MPSRRMMHIGAGSDWDLPANWLEIRTADGRYVASVLDRPTVEAHARKFPDRDLVVVSWLAGRVEGRYLVRGSWARTVTWQALPPGQRRAEPVDQPGSTSNPC